MSVSMVVIVLLREVFSKREVHLLWHDFRDKDFGLMHDK